MNISLGVIAVLVLLLQLIPVPHSFVEEARLYQDNDEMFGLETSYFVLTQNGTLVGWGGNSRQSVSSIFKFSSPYLFRRVAARGVAEFAYGTNLAMYVDENHILWGWGANESLLLSDKETNLRSATKVMDDVKSIALGREHALVIKTDGTLWTWGRNERGQLGNGTLGVRDGMIIDDSKFYEPQKIMDDVKYIRVVEDISFAISENGDLYMWGNTAICAPLKIAEEVQDINHAYIERSGAWFQYLSLNGDVYSFDLREKGANDPFKGPITRDVSSLCRMGVVKNDGSLWRWENEEDELKLVKECDNVVSAVDTSFYLTSSGRVYSDSIPQWLPRFPHSLLNVVPILRDIFLLLVIVKAIVNHSEKEEDALGKQN